MSDSKEKEMLAEIAIKPLADAELEEERMLHNHSQTEHQQEQRRRQWPVILLDAIYILVSLLLICKTSLCIAAAHIDSGTTGDLIGDAHPITIYLIKFNNQLTTLFTLVFGTILADLVRRVALWRAQNGASVAELEQWQASTSIPNTIKAVWTLKMYTVTSGALLVVWSWYYLGSQASTREYTLQDGGNKHHLLSTTLNTNGGPSAFDDVHWQLWNNSEKATYNAQFLTSLNSYGAPTAGASVIGQDNNGLMLIPYPEFLVHQKPGRGGYLEVTRQDETGSSVYNKAYTSIVGVQTYVYFPSPGPDYVWASQIVGDLDFTNSYLNTACQPARVRNISDFPAGVLDSLAVSINLTASDTVPATSNLSSQVTVWYRFDFDSNYNPFVGTPIQALSVSCQISVKQVLGKAKCNGLGCKVHKIKELPFTASETNQTIFSDPIVAQRFISNLLLSTGVPSDLSDTTALESYLYWDRPLLKPLQNGTQLLESNLLLACLPQNNEATAKAFNMTVAGLQTYCTQNLEDLATQRAVLSISPVLNGFLATYQQGQIGSTFDFSNDSSIAYFNGTRSSPFLNVGKFHGTYYSPRYALSIPWIIVDYVSCFVLLTLAIVGAYLRPRIFAPDVFGYVSSMTIHNPHITHPASTAEMGGMNRAKHLKKVKVQFSQAHCTTGGAGGLSLIQVDHPSAELTRQPSKAD